MTLLLADNAMRAVRRHGRGEDVPSAADYAPTVNDLDEARRLAEGMGARFLAVLIDDRGQDYRRDRIAVEKRLQARGISLRVKELLGSF